MTKKPKIDIIGSTGVDLVLAIDDLIDIIKVIKSDVEMLKQWKKSFKK